MRSPNVYSNLQVLCHVLANIMISFPTTIVAFLHDQCKENFRNNPCSLQCDFEWHFHQFKCLMLLKSSFGKKLPNHHIPIILSFLKGFLLILCVHLSIPFFVYIWVSNFFWTIELVNFMIIYQKAFEVSLNFFWHILS
jgi:hypothetical protein